MLAAYCDDYTELSGLPFAGEPSAGGLLDSMRRNGISRACVLQEWQSAQAYDSANVDLMCKPDEFYFYSYHGWLGRLQKENPELVCWGGVHPDEGDPLGSFETMMDEHQLFGLKLVPCMQQFKLNDERLMPVYRAAGERGRPVLMHTGADPILGMEDYGHPADAAEVATAFPGLAVIIAHLGMPFLDEARDALVQCPNLFADISFAVDLLDDADLTPLLKEVGTDRLLFGSDYPFCRTEESLRKFFELSLTSEEQAAILAGNAERLLGL